MRRTQRLLTLLFAVATLFTASAANAQRCAGHDPLRQPLYGDLGGLSDSGDLLGRLDPSQRVDVRGHVSYLDSREHLHQVLA